MPIRINLKEVFPSDAQEINVDKVNYNFNRLLELGVGTPGKRGKIGDEGSAGPIGPTGLDGTRGNKWYVGTGDPNSLTFIDLIDGDFFLDDDDVIIWQYDGASNPAVWNVVTDLSDVVNNYLLTQGVTFVRGFGETSPNDTRYITFANHGNNATDVVSDTSLGNSSNNDILFLNNFNEAFTLIDNFPLSTNDEYNALQKIHVDHSIFPLGRYHLELGSLYLDTRVSPSETKLSSLKHNLKMRFIKDDVSGTATYALSNHFMNISRFSLSKPELASIGEIDENGLFEFVLPKYNNESGLLQDEMSIRFGAREANGEYSPNALLTDGIEIIRGARSASFGIVDTLENDLIIPGNEGNYVLIDTTLDGVFINKPLLQTGGNFTQIITTEPEIVDTDTVNIGSAIGHHMSQSMHVYGNNIWISSSTGTSQSSSAQGIIRKYDITDPEAPEFIGGMSGDARISTSFAGLPTQRDQHGHSFSFFPIYEIGLVKDIAEFGRYLVSVHHRSAGALAVNYAHNPNDLYIFETDSFINTPFPISSMSVSALQDAYKVQIHGKYAWVITNPTYRTGPYNSLSVPPAPKAKLTAIDLSDPENPIVADSYAETDDLTTNTPAGNKYLDFDIKDTKAIVIKHTRYDSLVPDPLLDKHALELIVFDITNPESFSDIQIAGNFPGFPTYAPYAPQSSLTLEARAVADPSTEHAGLDVNGRYAYVVWEDRFFIVEIDNSVTLKSLTLLTTTSIASDVIVRGNYAYVLVSKGVTGSVQIYDISNKVTPTLIVEHEDSNFTNASRLAVSGKHIYVVSTNGSTSVDLLTLDTTGTQVPAANIGELKTDSLQVHENAYIKNSLTVKNDVQIGRHLHAHNISSSHTKVSLALNASVIPTPISGAAPPTAVGVHPNARWYNVIPSNFFSPKKIKLNQVIHDHNDEAVVHLNGTWHLSPPESSRVTVKTSGYYNIHGTLSVSTPDTELPYLDFVIVLYAYVNGTTSLVPAVPAVYTDFNHGGQLGSGDPYVLNGSIGFSQDAPALSYGNAQFHGNVTIYLNAGDYIELGVQYFGDATGSDTLYIIGAALNIEKLV